MALKHMHDGDRTALSRKLREATRDFCFAWGRTAVCGNDEVAISTDALQNDEGKIEHLVTVMAGFSPAESIAGCPWTVRNARRQICRVGQTDARGQFWLRDLETGDYRLQFDRLLCAVTIPVADVFAAALGGTEPPHQAFSGEGISAQLLVTPAEQWMLEVTIDPAGWDPTTKSLVRFRIYDNEHRLLVGGFIGLYDGSGAGCGRINIDLLDRTARARGTGCDVEVGLILEDDLMADDRPVLEACRSITEHPESRRVLQRAIDALER